MFHIKNPSVIYVAYSHIGRPKNSIQKYGFVNNLHKFQYFIKLLLGYYSQFNYNAQFDIKKNWPMEVYCIHNSKDLTPPSSGFTLPNKLLEMSTAAYNSLMCKLG